MTRHSPAFTTRTDLLRWARDRWRYPDPAPDARERAIEDIRDAMLAHVHLPVDEGKVE